MSVPVNLPRMPVHPRYQYWRDLFINPSCKHIDTCSFRDRSGASHRSLDSAFKRSTSQTVAQTTSDVPADNDSLIAAITRLAGHINAAQHRFLILLAALIERDAWGDGGAITSPAHWLNYYCGIELGAAREKVRVAKSLEQLPQINAAFASGAISYSKVRAMTRSATPQNEAILLNIARRWYGPTCGDAGA